MQSDFQGKGSILDQEKFLKKEEVMESCRCSRNIRKIFYSILTTTVDLKIPFSKRIVIIKFFLEVLQFPRRRVTCHCFWSEFQATLKCLCTINNNKHVSIEELSKGKNQNS